MCETHCHQREPDGHFYLAAHWQIADRLRRRIEPTRAPTAKCSAFWACFAAATPTRATAPLAAGGAVENGAATSS